MSDKWDRRFLELAEHISQWSRDPSTKCGAVIVDKDKRVVSIGFNGFPKGVDDSEERYSNREQKYPRVLHAEKNAILFARRDLAGCTLYVWPMPPCSQCAAAVIQSGITRVVSTVPTVDQLTRWGQAMYVADSMLSEAGVEQDWIGEPEDTDHDHY